MSLSSIGSCKGRPGDADTYVPTVETCSVAADSPGMTTAFRPCRRAPVPPNAAKVQRAQRGVVCRRPRRVASLRCARLAPPCGISRRARSSNRRPTMAARWASRLATAGETLLPSPHGGMRACPCDRRGRRRVATPDRDRRDAQDGPRVVEHPIVTRHGRVRPSRLAALRRREPRTVVSCRLRRDASGLPATRKRRAPRRIFGHLFEHLRDPRASRSYDQRAALVLHEPSRAQVIFWSNRRAPHSPEMSKYSLPACAAPSWRARARSRAERADCRFKSDRRDGYISHRQRDAAARQRVLGLVGVSALAFELHRLEALWNCPASPENEGVPSTLARPTIALLCRSKPSAHTAFGASAPDHTFMYGLRKTSGHRRRPPQPARLRRQRLARPPASTGRARRRRRARSRRGTNPGHRPRANRHPRAPRPPPRAPSPVRAPRLPRMPPTSPPHRADTGAQGFRLRASPKRVRPERQHGRRQGPSTWQAAALMPLYGETVSNNRTNGTVPGHVISSELRTRALWVVKLVSPSPGSLGRACNGAAATSLTAATRGQRRVTGRRCGDETGGRRCDPPGRAGGADTGGTSVGRWSEHGQRRGRDAARPPTRATPTRDRHPVDVAPP